MIRTAPGDQAHPSAVTGPEQLLRGIRVGGHPAHRRRPGHIPQHGAVPRPGRHLRDARARRPGADDGDLLGHGGVLSSLSESPREESSARGPSPL